MLRFQKRKTTGISIHLTALIDIVFLLLIYFLLTSNFVEQEGIPISVPKVTKSGLYSEKVLVVEIDKAGTYYFEGKAVEDQKLGPLLRAYLALSSEKSVAVKADRQVAYDRVVQALDIAKESGAQRLNLTVEQKNIRRGR